ncbi:Glutaredoxin [Coemansia sp. RSA 2050]|nr:Glutaredoxin [Coemansia sp. RSA 2050]KAJ2734612.1 Glutaredoxin [Coemansia sp. BCRC 34962]
MSKVSKLVSGLITQNPVMVFSKSFCPYCSRAKDELTKRKIAFKAIELDNTKDGGDIQAYLQQLTTQRTVPNIFANGHHIGGCDDTLDKLASGKFQQLLAGKKGPFVVAEKPEKPAPAKGESGSESERTDTFATTPVAQPEGGKGKAVAESKPTKPPVEQPPAKGAANVFPPAA